MDGVFENTYEREREEALQRRLKRRVFRDPHKLLEGYPDAPPPGATGDDDPQFVWTCGLVRRVGSIVLRGARNEADVEDAAQDICFALWLAWVVRPDLRSDPARLLKYLWTAFRNRRINLHRGYERANRWHESISVAIEMIDPEGIDPQAQLERLELLRFLYAEIDLFPPKRKHVMKLVFEEGLTHAQAAAEIGTRQDDIAKAVAIGMQVLRKRIAIHFQEGRP
jgi:RNA polymerase sigma factor (sigma-70 family)